METGKLKPWQIAVFVVAFGAIAFGAYSILTANKVKIRDEILFVDVQTGELFDYKIRKSAVIPAKNPDTGNASLLPVDEEADGTLRIRERYLNVLDIIPVAPDAVDPQTGVVTVKSKDTRRLEVAGGGKLRDAATGGARRGEQADTQPQNTGG